MKSDKELAVEITVALIQANPRLVLPKSGPVSDVLPALSLADVKAILRQSYQMVHDLDKN